MRRVGVLRRPLFVTRRIVPIVAFSLGAQRVATGEPFRSLLVYDAYCARTKIGFSYFGRAWIVSTCCCTVLLWMFHAFLERNLSSCQQAKTPRFRAANKNRNQSDALRPRLQLGEEILRTIREEHGDEFADKLLMDAANVSVPRSFWKHFFEHMLELTYTTKQRLRCYRALKLYIERRGNHSSARAMCGLDAPTAKRLRVGNRRLGRKAKAAGLSYALLQVFVDEFQVIQSRSDSNLLLKRARELRADLLDAGFSEVDLPNLEDAAGRMWFRRWRLENKISYRACGLQLKVAWSKVCSRTRTLLTNIFRIKAFYKKCHPDGELKFFSADQKPSWFNNCGSLATLANKGRRAPSIRENHAQTRQRYSLFTIMQSWCDYGVLSADDPPPLFVLFKGKPGGHTHKSLLETTILPSWLRVQFQEQGSYREEDVELDNTPLFGTDGVTCSNTIKTHASAYNERRTCFRNAHCTVF